MRKTGERSFLVFIAQYGHICYVPSLCSLELFTRPYAAPKIRRETGELGYRKDVG